MKIPPTGWERCRSITIVLILFGASGSTLWAQETLDRSFTAKDAQIEQTQNELRAALVGNQGARVAAIQRADAVVGDKTKPAAQRFQLAALAELVRQQAYAADINQLREEREVSARRLLTAFPDEPGGYEALLREADNNPDIEHAKGLAQELLAMEKAPSAIKQAAQLLHDRALLVGRPLQEVVNEAWGETGIFAEAGGRPVVIYTWASWSPGSLEQARDLAKVLPSEATLFGLGLDAETPAALALLEEHPAPGAQLTEPPRKAGQLARVLQVGKSSPIYIINAEGIFIDVAGEKVAPSVLVERLNQR